VLKILTALVNAASLVRVPESGVFAKSPAESRYTTALFPGEPETFFSAKVLPSSTTLSDSEPDGEHRTSELNVMYSLTRGIRLCEMLIRSFLDRTRGSRLGSWQQVSGDWFRGRGQLTSRSLG
jgi:hypothetical protein